MRPAETKPRGATIFYLKIFRVGGPKQHKSSGYEDEDEDKAEVESSGDAGIYNEAYDGKSLLERVGSILVTRKLRGPGDLCQASGAATVRETRHSLRENIAESVFPSLQGAAGCRICVPCLFSAVCSMQHAATDRVDAT